MTPTALPGDPLDLLLPGVAAWFRDAFPNGPTEAQRLSWPRIARGENVLLVSPTGTGKTIAAFLVALDRVARRRLAGDEERRLAVVYVSPLKALDNDVHRNLEVPAAGIRERTGIEVTAAVRTGDTPSRVRARIQKQPPDVLITTPESLYLMLTTSGMRPLFGAVDTVVLDEVHSVASTKRGAHLALTLERLEGVVAAAGGEPPQRIALSATVQPPARVAAFVAGAGRRAAPIVVPSRKALDLSVVSPLGEAGPLDDEASAWEPAIDAVAAEIESRTTTLVFCNSRRHAERVAAKLEERTGRPLPTHHGAIARAPREETERALKRGALKALVATGSLELGVDIGHVDAVVQITSPKGVARGLQRVGRAGHLVGETSRGVFVPLHLDDLFECAATVEAMRAGAVEEIRPPEAPLDVLAQQLVAEAVARAAEGTPATATELFDLFRRADPYRALGRRLFDETLAMLSGKYPKERFADLAPKLVWDRATDRVSPLPAARLAAILDGGTIGDRGLFRAVLPDRKTVVGELDEEFVYETKAGDVFLLGSRAWRAAEIDGDRVVVEPAPGEPARMPFWRGEGLGRSPELGRRVGALRRLVAENLDAPGLRDLLKERGAVDENGAAAMLGSIRREVAESGGVASDRRVSFETFPNDLGDPCVVVRSVFGRGVNLPWSLALASVLREETGVDVEAVANDDGILLRLPRAEREVPLERLARLGAAEARERLLADLPNSSMFGAHFRQNAQRALLLPRARAGRRTPFWLQRLRAKDLLQTTRALPDFPIVAETYRDCLKDTWEYDALLSVLGQIESGAIEAATDRRRHPSPAGSRLLFDFIAIYMYEWDAPKAEKGLHALALNRELLGEVLGETFRDGLRPEAAEEARAQASRLVPHRQARTEAELLSLVQELGDLSLDEIRERCSGAADAFAAALVESGSLVRVSVGGATRLVSSEESNDYAALASEDPPLATVDRLVLRLAATRGPIEVAAIAERLGLSEARVGESLARLRDGGLVVAGTFGGSARAFASARLAETVRRKTLALLRREIRPVPVAAYRAFLAKRQGLEIGARFAGETAAEHALALLRGYPAPALSWETSLLPARLAEPEPDALDVLAAKGLLVFRADGQKEARAARLSFFFRGEGAVVLPASPPDLGALSRPARRLHETFALHGASFWSDLERASGVAAREMDGAMRELLLRGLVTGDGLHGFRDLLRDGARATRPEPPGVPIGTRPGRGDLRAAEARVAARLHAPGRFASRAAGSAFRSGRFSLLAQPGVLGEPLSAHERAEAWARILLARWGVVSRETLDAEDPAVVRWSDVAPVFARMEMRGDLRRGEFVEGRGPMQYAEPDAVEELRALRDGRESARDAAPRLAIASGADPVLAGSGLGRDVLVALDRGAVLFRLDPEGRLVTGDAAPTDRERRAAFEAAMDLKRRARDPLGRPRRLEVATVDGRAVAGTPLVPLLESLGFSRDGARYAWRAL